MRNSLLSIGLVATLGSFASACNYCGNDEIRAITVNTVDSLSITRAGQTRRFQLTSRVAGREIDEASFDAVFNAIEDRSSSNRGIVVNVSGIDPVTNELITLAIAVPADLDRNDQFTIGRTFVAEPGLSTDPGLWGARDLQGTNTADVAFSMSTYSFPPPQHTITYRATAASGTIRVTQRASDYAELELSINTTDATGAPAVLNGRIQITTERHTPPCIS